MVEVEKWSRDVQTYGEMATRARISKDVRTTTCRYSKTFNSLMLRAIWILTNDLLISSSNRCENHDTMVWFVRLDKITNS